ncbi:MAG: S9 family peptidase [Candidatus Amulumruptor caecigallinarius]|nr:S9 family peptidase [Candidatus Amulumruptor caecigallinarius]MCM1397505.1 S9 family peptidase [Candidatus Amulumruptor caecigallinarius]MCM1454407.1 S9 family peptidase [bacterium]
MTLRIALASTIALAAVTSSAADIDRFTYPGNRPEPAPAITFMPDGETYASLSGDGKRVTLHEIRSGKETGTLIDVETTREGKIDAIEAFMVSPEGSKVMVRTATEPVYRRSVTGAYYVYEVRSRILKPLSTEHRRQQAPLFSPDGRMVAFVDSGNIFIKKLDYGTEVAVTRDGAKNKVINGVPDWTYEEEFTTTCSMAWSPDNLTLSYLRYDESEVPLYTLPIYAGACDPRSRYELYPGTFSYKYPVAGQPNSKVTLRSYNVETRKDWQVPLNGTDIEYVPRIAYGPSADKLIVATLNRDQTRMELLSVNPRSTVGRSLLVEQSGAGWLDPATYEEITLLSSGIVLQSERTGHNHLYHYSYEGELTRTITEGDWDVTAFYGYDAAKNAYFFQSTKAGSMNRVISRIDAKGKVTDLNPSPGTFSAIFSPEMKYAVQTYSSSTEAPKVTITEGWTAKPLRTLVDNSGYAAAYAACPKREFFTVKGASGDELQAMIVKPAGFDPSKQYPLIVDQYSGPGSQSVLDRWSADWTLYFASQGYVVVTIDPRGCGGKGRDFSRTVYRRLGEAETADLCAAVRNLCADKSWIDPERVGIYGWSYGGFESLMCATQPSTPFKAAVAVAPVTDWRFYDTAYTERYMLTPGQNPDGYRLCAPLNRVSNLGARVLLMWGTADDNVHPANSLEFLSRLEASGRWADALPFPNSDHSINGCTLRSTVYSRMLQFFNDTL